MNNLELLAAFATAPTRAFEELRARPRFWLPLLLLVVSTAGITFWYYSIVDIEWFKDAMYGNLPADQRAAAMSMVGRNMLLWSSVIGTFIGMPIVFVVLALYLLLAAKVTKLPQGFKHWFAFACWTSIPGLIGTVVAALFLIISDTAQLSPSVLQPLSINELLLHRPMSSPGYTFFESLAIPSLLTWALMIIGVRTWSQRSWMFSAIFILLPIVVIYGLWAFFAFR